MNDDEKREIFQKAALFHAEHEQHLRDLQRQLDEAIAMQKAGEQLVAELRIELSQSRNDCASYRAEAEQARADNIATQDTMRHALDELNGIGIRLSSFVLPSERLPGRRKGRNGKAAEPLQLQPPSDNPTAFDHGSPELDDLAKRIGDIANGAKPDEPPAA